VHHAIAPLERKARKRLMVRELRGTTATPIRFRQDTKPGTSATSTRWPTRMPMGADRHVVRGSSHRGTGEHSHPLIKDVISGLSRFA